MADHDRMEYPLPRHRMRERNEHDTYTPLSPRPAQRRRSPLTVLLRPYSGPRPGHERDSDLKIYSWRFLGSSGFIMLFMSGEEEPDEQDTGLGFDTHCLVTAGQGTAYGCVREAVLTGNVLRVSLDPAALTALGLEDAEIEATIEAPAEDVARFREVLAQILAYGRADALPTHVVI